MQPLPQKTKHLPENKHISADYKNTPLPENKHIQAEYRSFPHCKC